MKKILIFGSILAVTLLILASFPSVVSANNEQPNRLYDGVQEIRERDWKPGDIIIFILTVAWELFGCLLLFLGIVNPAGY